MVDLGFTEGLSKFNKMCSKISVVVGILLFISCGADKQPDSRDTPVKGSIHISVDESFQPVIEEQLKVHHASFPNTEIRVTYQSEAACLRDLQEDSTRMVVVARGLTDDEAEGYQKYLSFKPIYGILAYDAIAVLISRNRKDSLFTLQQLTDILNGNNPVPAVMDGLRATSTVRFLQDSLLKGGPFGKNVVGVENSKAVVEAIKKNPDAIGFVGMSWVGDVYDKQQQAYQQQIAMARLECTQCEEKGIFAKPSQATITYGQYPLARPLYYILKENWAGLGTGFMNFMSLERGQLIFRRAFLAPAKIDFRVRSGKIKEQ
ncbi:MAG: phosphate ABC transporter substrate-binding protein, PhoT family [Chitinophagia bacterium]|nr:phosphate ABC transporter substrate-binding protein, PhoT family [Chitinophagia bacterium]